MKTITGLAAAVSLGVVTACGAPSTEQDSSEENVTGAEAPIGTFEAWGILPHDVGLHVTRLLLKSDGTFIRDFDDAFSDSPYGNDAPGGAGVTHVTGTDAGRFKITKSTNSPRRYLHLWDDKNTKLARYEFSWDKAKATLDLDETGSTVEPVHYLKRAKKGYCAAATDCKIQDLPTPRCVGNWTCAKSVCEFGSGVSKCGM